MRRINLWGGPCSGKSTIAAQIYSKLKTSNIKTELVREHAKLWAYRKHTILPYDQLYLFSKQIQEESMLLQNNVELIITDSPIFLSVYYSQYVSLPFNITNELLRIAKFFDTIYPSINIFIDRCNKPYIEQGRYQTEQEAIEIDTNILEFLHVHNIDYILLPFDSNISDKIMEIING